MYIVAHSIQPKPRAMCDNPGTKMRMSVASTSLAQTCGDPGTFSSSQAHIVAGNPGWISKARGLPRPASVAGKLRLEILETALGLAPRLEGFGAFKACSKGTGMDVTA